MNTCPKCGKEIPEGTQTCPECGGEIEVRPVRGVPNIPRREPDPLPERPGKDGSNGIPGKVLLVIAVAALLLFLKFGLKVF